MGLWDQNKNKAPTVETNFNVKQMVPMHNDTQLIHVVVMDMYMEYFCIIRHTVPARNNEKSHLATTNISLYIVELGSCWCT